jgi:hypothetical protein
MAAPPLELGALHVTVAVPLLGVALTALGAPGNSTSTVPLTLVAVGEFPMPFTALTVTE